MLTNTPFEATSRSISSSTLAQGAADGGNDIGLDEAALWFTHRFIDLAGGRENKADAARSVDRRRAVEAALWIEAHSAEPIEIDPDGNNVEAVVSPR